MNTLSPTQMLLILLPFTLVLLALWQLNPVLPLLFGPGLLLLWGLLRDGAVVVVIGFVLLSAFRLHELSPALLPLRLPQCFALLALAVLTWRLLISRDLRPYFTVESGWLLALFAITVVGALLASNRGLAMSYLTGSWIKVVLMCFACCWLLQRPRHIELLAWGVIFAGALVAMVALHNSVNGLEMVEGSRVTIGRSYGSMLGDPNDLALVLLLPISFAFSATVCPHHHVSGWQSTMLRIFAALTLVLLVMAMFATQSRGGLLGMVAVTLIVLSQRFSLPKWVWLLAPLLLLLLMTVAGVAERQSGGAAESGIDESAMGRLYAWQAAWSMMLANPVFGVGLDNFYVNYFFHSPHWDGKNHAVHSSWFQVMAEAGAAGLLLFIGFYLLLLKRSFSLLASTSARCWPLACSAGLVGFGVGGTFLTQAFTWPLYIMAALVWAQWRLNGSYQLRGTG